MSWSRSLRPIRATLTILAHLLAPAAGRAELPAAVSDHGQLGTHEGVAVLELRGSHEQMAYAHGYLLADEIIALFDEYMLTETVMPDLVRYEREVLPAVARQFDWRPYEAELAALLAGIGTARAEKGLRLSKLARDLTIADLKAANTLADSDGLMCSSFSAWGTLTTDGETITGRNLDYNQTDRMAQLQHLRVVRPTGGLPYLEVNWPGIIGVYTAVNADGVSVLCHDANSLEKSWRDGFTPRGLIFRAAAESARAETAFADVERVLAAHRVICGNNLHVSAPVRAAGSPPARVFEYDSNARGDGFTARPPDGADALWCTNHVRARQSAQPCGRYDKLTRALRAARKDGQKLAGATAFKLIRRAAVESTLHTVVIEPAAGRMLLHVPAIRSEPIQLDFREWLRAARVP